MQETIDGWSSKRFLKIDLFIFLCFGFLQANEDSPDDEKYLQPRKLISFLVMAFLAQAGKTENKYEKNCTPTE